MLIGAFFVICTTQLQAARVQTAASAKAQVWSALKAATVPTYICKAMPELLLRPCKTKTQCENTPKTEKLSLLSHIPEQIAHWLGQSTQEVGIMCLQQNNNVKKNHTHTTQFGKDHSPTFKTIVSKQSCVSISLCSLEQRSHKMEKGEKVLQHFLTKP